MERVGLLAALTLAVLAFSYVLALYLRLRAAGPRVEIQYQDRLIPQEVTRYVEVPREVTKYVEVPKEVTPPVQPSEPDALLRRADDFADPAVLPEVPDGVTDSIADGARYSSVTVRAASTRGESSRKEGRLRRQSTAMAVLRQFNPPVLISVVAAGQPGARAPQVGAAQACRSVQHKVADAAAEIQEAWPAGTGQDDRIGRCLYDALRAMEGQLTDAALVRGLHPREIATELTCVLTRLGDGERRSHLAFGVGRGLVFAQRPGEAPRAVLSPEAGAPLAVLPDAPEAVRWSRFETAPGDLVVACTASTVALLNQNDFQKAVLSEWLAGAPGLSRFLAQLNHLDQFCTDDRTAVALWEVKPR
jgi:hypothetical protein